MILFALNFLLLITIIVVVCIALYINFVLKQQDAESKESEEDTSIDPITLIDHIKVIPATNEISRGLIPHKIHQIWLGDLPPPANIEKWKNLCQKYGYTYRLWREIDLQDLENQAYFNEMLHRRFYQGASDVARYEILNRLGGIYCDADTIPMDLPIFNYLPEQGFGVSLEHNPISKSLGAGAIFTANGFMVSCPDHPILTRVIKSLPGNFESFKEIDYIEAFLVTGPYLLTSCLFGIYTIIDKNWIMNDGHTNSFRLIQFTS